MTDYVEIFTDGSCWPNPNGTGGIGVILKQGKHRREFSQGYANTTNNRMEMRAAIEGLKLLKRPCKVTIYSDSQYLVNAIEAGWLVKWQANNWLTSSKPRKPVKNKDLWLQLIELFKIHEVNFVWIRGHAGHTENEQCDFLAESARSYANLISDCGYTPE